MRSIALASVTVPTVDRALAPIRSWSTMIAVVRPSSTSTSGRASDGMNPWTKALYVSLIMRWDSAAMVSKTSELLPDPDTPVNTVSRRLGSSTLTSLRLFSRAPCTRIDSWLSAAGSSGDSVSVLVVMVTPAVVVRVSLEDERAARGSTDYGGPGGTGAPLPLLPMADAPIAPPPALVRRARGLAWFGLGWHLVEAAVAVA